MTHPLLKFFALTFGLTWACWWAALALTEVKAPAVLVGPLFLLGTFAPGIVSLALTARVGGAPDLKALLRRILAWEVSIRWYVFAGGYMIAIKLSVAVIYRLATGAWPQFGTEPWYLMAGAVLISTWAQAGEELGWRGYALPRLSARFGLGPASIILGVIWASWHLPLFFFPAGDTYGQSFPIYLAGVTALSVAMAWLYWRTSGSLLLVMLLHAAVNNTKDIVPSIAPGATDALSLSPSPIAWLTAALMWLTAAYFLLRMRRVTVLPGG